LDESNIDDTSKNFHDDNADQSELVQNLNDQANEATRNEEDDKIERIITMSPSEANRELKRDDNYSQRGSKSSKGAVILKEGHFKSAEKTYDEIYILDHNF